MLRFGKAKVAKEDFFGAKEPIKIVISKLVKRKNNSKYLIGYLDEVIRPSILILPKMSGYVKRFKDKGGDKNKCNKLISLHKDDEKLLEKYKTIWTKAEYLKNIELNALPVYDDRYIKTKIRTYGDKIYTNFHGLSALEDGIECKSFTVISIDSLFVYGNKYDMQVHLDNFAHEIVDNQMIDYLDGNLFETDED